MTFRETALTKYPWLRLKRDFDKDEARRHSAFGSALLTLFILGFIAGVAYADSRVEEISLGYLYILPIALSGLVNRRRVTFVLIIICIVMHDLFGPPHAVASRIFLNLMAFTGFSVIALLINHHSKEREAL